MRRDRDPLPARRLQQPRRNQTGSATSHEQSVAKKTTVVVPPVSKGTWRAVVIGVTDKKIGRTTDCQIPIGSQTSLSGSDLTITVEHFLPHFIMQGTLLTSQSDDPKNPAAQVRVVAGGEEIFTGWLFAYFPTTHVSQHPRYGFTLKGYILAWIKQERSSRPPWQIQAVITAEV